MDLPLIFVLSQPSSIFRHPFINCEIIYLECKNYSKAKKKNSNKCIIIHRPCDVAYWNKCRPFLISLLSLHQHIIYSSTMPSFISSFQVLIPPFYMLFKNYVLIKTTPFVFVNDGQAYLKKISIELTYSQVKRPLFWPKVSWPHLSLYYW